MFLKISCIEKKLRFVKQIFPSMKASLKKVVQVYQLKILSTTHL